MKLEAIIEQEIFETPQNTFDQDFGLDDLKQNTQYALSLLKERNKTIVGKYGNGFVSMYEFPRMFVLINHEDEYHPKVEYIVKFELKYSNFLKRQTVQQIVVWRKMLSNFTNGLAKTIFFNELIQKYKTIVTDAYQTSDGKRFWGNRIVEALKDNLYVYYVNTLKPRTIKRIYNINEIDKLMNDNKIWGDSSKYQAQRLVICSDELEEYTDQHA